MNSRSEIVNEFARIAQEHGKDLPPLTDQMLLLESGLDSLCLATIVIRLEGILGVDPFDAETTLFPVTFGEFVQLYEACVQS
jgi:acyl carrier protein